MNRERLYDVLRGPVVTEKSTRGSEHNQITFRVALNATKPEIKKAVEELFSVKVKKVNTICGRGKLKRFRGISGRRSAYKKAVVTLVEGQMIDVMTGV